MLIVYEYATCVLAVSIGATMLFTACVMFLVLIEGGSIMGGRCANPETVPFCCKADGWRLSLATLNL